MGAWGLDPWENDGAADWFAGLFEGTTIVDDVLEALNGDGGEDTVAAIWLSTELCRVYIWPIHRYEETLDAAIAAAERILAGEDEEGMVEMWDNPAFNEQIEGFRDVLVARRNPGDAEA